MSVFDQKLKSLKAEGYTDFGVILIDPKTKKRCTVDQIGRVQHWDVDGSGVMIAPRVSRSADKALNQGIKKMNSEKAYKLPSGAVISVPESIHETANALANRFYVAMGNVSRPDFDYSASQHHLELLMYVMALEAIDYESEYGF